MAVRISNELTLVVSVATFLLLLGYVANPTATKILDEDEDDTVVLEGKLQNLIFFQKNRLKLNFLLNVNEFQPRRSK